MPLALDEMLDGLAAALELPEAGLQQHLDAAAASTETLLDVEGVGLMLAREDGPPFVGAGEASGRALEHAQEMLGEGPGLDSMRERTVVAAEDLGRDDRWPRLRTDPAARRVRSLLSAPIWLRDRAAGNLNLFARRPRTCSADERRALSIVAGVLGAHLDIVLRAYEPARLVALLIEADEQDDAA